MATLSQPMQRLLAAFRTWRERPLAEEAPKIHVDEIAAKVAAFYEKVRNIVDYHDEHLLRKRFIVRTLKRRLMMAPGEDFAEALLKEIIRAGHLPNDTIPQGKIVEVQALIDGMRAVMERLRGQNPREARTEPDSNSYSDRVRRDFLASARREERGVAPALHERRATPRSEEIARTRRDATNSNDSIVAPPRSIAEDTPSEVASRTRLNLSASRRSMSSSRALEAWLIEIAANAIEENLVPAMGEAMLFDLAFATMRNDIAVSGAALNETDIALALFIALQRALFHVDDDQLGYRLFAFIAPQWKMLPPGESERIAMELPSLKENIDAAIKSRHLSSFEKLCNRYNTAFFLVGDIIEEYKTVDALTGLLQDEAALRSAIERMYARRFERERHRLHRLAFFSVLSFLLSKIAVALAVEIPIETYLAGHFSILQTTLNILFPPFLMLLIVAGIRLPGKGNVAQATVLAADMVYEEKTRRYFIVVPKRHGVIGAAVIYGAYLALFAFSFYVLHRVLTALQFNIANIIVFALFISLVLAAGVKIKNRARELSVAAERPTVAAFIVDLFIFPFITMGQWIIAGLAKFNILVLAMNAMIELPLQFFVEFLENLRGFIESKKEGLR